MEKVLSNFDYNNSFIRFIDITVLANEIVNSKDLFLKNKLLLIKELKRFYMSKGEKIQEVIQQEAFEKLAEKICIFLKLEDKEIRRTILRKRLEAEFAMNIGNLNSVGDNAKTTVKLNIKNNNIDFEIIKNQEIIINDYINLIKQIVYIDDPFILDDLDERWIFRIYTIFEHRADLLDKIVNAKRKNSFTIIDELVIKNKLEKILEIMNNVCDGSLLIEEGSKS